MVVFNKLKNGFLGFLTGRTAQALQAKGNMRLANAALR